MANEDILLSKIRTAVLVTPALVILGLIGFTEYGWRAKPQPINFSHKLHAGTREIDCKYCHRGVEKGQHAGVPSVTECWQCHQGLIKQGSGKAPVIDQPEIRNVLLKQYVETQKDVHWFKNYDLPEHVKFSHRSHLNALGKDSCVKCHGDVKTQEIIKLNQRTTMGWCIECHRANNAPVDCTTCHY